MTLHVCCPPYALLVVTSKHLLHARVAGVEEIACEVQAVSRAAHGFSGREAFGSPVEHNKRLIDGLPTRSLILPWRILAQIFHSGLPRIDIRSGLGTEGIGQLRDAGNAQVQQRNVGQEAKSRAAFRCVRSGGACGNARLPLGRVLEFASARAALKRTLLALLSITAHLHRTWHGGHR